ncbi:MAG: DUF5683 domain-containing protein [Bacteroidota bacterium]
MLNRSFICTVISIAFIGLFSFSQTQIDSTGISDIEDFKLDTEITKPKREAINPLAPSKAAFYSAILPGLGQAYNKKYWKIPLVYAAIGTGVYFYITNTNELNRYRDAYKRRLAGFEDDEFFGTISDDGLIRAQQQFRRNQELSLLVTLGLYALNIIDANVDAHLLQYNVDENLAIKPHVKYNELEDTTDLGLTVNFKF